jgi:hypothetical protein
MEEYKQRQKTLFDKFNGRVMLSSGWTEDKEGDFIRLRFSDKETLDIYINEDGGLEITENLTNYKGLPA